MERFFQPKFTTSVASPNGQFWWHHMPLPDGTRIKGANQDVDLHVKMWDALKIPRVEGLKGRSVLDIGANDGYFSLAALVAGAAKVTAINSPDWNTYPANINYASAAWDLKPIVITSDFERHSFEERFDVIFFFGVLYHLEDVFNAMKRLKGLLAEGGVIYIETQMSGLKLDLPVFEYASDLYPTQVKQDKRGLYLSGLSNYLLPNEHAMKNLAHSYDFSIESLSSPRNLYERDNPTRQLFALRHS